MHSLRAALSVIQEMERKAKTHKEEIERKNDVIKGLKKRIHVRFDEEIIAEHDKERGTRMKIDEPKTPFVREDPLEYPELADEHDDIPVIHSDVKFTVGASKAKPDTQFSVVEEDDEEESVGDEEELVKSPLQNLANPVPASGNVTSRRPMQLDLSRLNETLESGEKKNDFEEHRAKHYNEFEKLQAWRSKHKQDLEDEDDEEEDEAENESHEQEDQEDDEEQEGHQEAIEDGAGR